MTEQLISFETAKLAKEKGFDIPNERYYDFIGDICSNSGVVNFNASKESLYSAPTQSLLNTWLRQVHSLFVLPDYIECKESEWQGTKEGDKVWQMNIFCLKELKLITVSIFHPVFEVALEDGLKEALKRVK